MKPQNIFAVTFTNKAANEMRERTLNLLNVNPKEYNNKYNTNNLWIRTFHSACVSILRNDIDKLGLNRHFTIYDEGDSKLLMRGIIDAKECPLFGKKCTPEHPIGPCMVSFEGACNIEYRYKKW